MRNSIILAVVLLLAGCATTPPVINTVIQRVEIPIAVPCNAVIPPRPAMNFEKLVIEDDLFTKTKSVLADRQLYEGYSAELLAALKSCK